MKYFQSLKQSLFQEKSCNSVNISQLGKSFEPNSRDHVKIIENFKAKDTHYQPHFEH